MKNEDYLKPQRRYIKADKTRQDGDALWVFGYLITEAIDSYNTILTLSGAREALKDYEQYRNVREMHQPDAVGKAWILELDDKGLYIGVKVVDADAIRKVEEGVLQGLSVGFEPVDGHYETRQDQNIFVFDRYKIIEATICDRNSNPEAGIDYFTRAEYNLAGKDEGWTFDWKNDADAIVEKFGWDGMKTACCWYDPDNAEIKSGYKLPVMKLKSKDDDKLTLYYYACVAAMAALNGARGGVDIPEVDRKTAYNKLAKYYKLFDEEPPELRATEERMEKTKFSKFIQDHLVAPLQRLVAEESKKETEQSETPPASPPTQDFPKIPVSQTLLDSVKEFRSVLLANNVSDAELSKIDVLLGRVEVAEKKDDGTEKRFAELQKKFDDLQKRFDEAVATRQSKTTVDQTQPAESRYGGAFIPY